MSQELLENSLKLGENLLNKGDREGALAIFHEVIMSKRKGSMDKIMIRLVEMCAELENLSVLKETLLVFRNLVQHTSPQSLQLVLDRLRLKVEEKVSEAVNNAAEPVEVIDLEIEEPPETLIMNAVSGNFQSNKQAVINSMRFLWEVYKLSLDLLKTNGKMVVAYKDSAISAINFCDRYKRPSECRKLSEILRLHLQNIFRLQNSQSSLSLTYMMRLDEETLASLIPIREKLMDVCMRLNLWQEAFRAAEDTRVLICEGKPTPAALAKYWHGLSRIFWKAGQGLFHAYSLYLYYYQNKKYNKKFFNEGSLASCIVLSTLAVPTFNLGNDITGIISESILNQEINAKLSVMLIQSGMVTREQLIDLLHTNNLLELAGKEIRDLFYLLEGKSLPLSLPEQVKPLLEKIKEKSEYSVYVQAIEQLLVGRMLAQLSKCYKTMKLETLSKLIDFIPPETLEKYILEISIKTSLRIRIDQFNNSISFEDVSETSESQTQMARVKEYLTKVHSLINKENDYNERKRIIDKIFGNLDELLNEDLESRQALTDDGKKINKERDELLRKKEEEEKKIKESEKRKAEEVMRNREETHRVETSLNDIEKERRSIKLMIIYSIIEKMRTIGFSSKEMSIKGKKVEKMTEDELLEVGPEELGKLSARLYEKSMKDRQIQVKNQQKQLEYNERAKREYMNPLILEKWAESSEQEVATKKQMIKEKYEKDLAMKKQYERLSKFQANYTLEETKRAQETFNTVFAGWNERMKSHYKTEIIRLAVKRREDERNARIEEEKKMKEEAERRKKAEENRLKEREITKAGPSDWRTKEAPKSIYGAAKPAVIQRSNVPEKPSGGIYRNTAEPAPRVIEEVKAEGPKRRFINKKKQGNAEEIKDKDGFTQVTKQSTHHN